MNHDLSIGHALATAMGGAWVLQPLHASSFCTTWRTQGAHETLFVKSLPVGQADVSKPKRTG